MIMYGKVQQSGQHSRPSMITGLIDVYVLPIYGLIEITDLLSRERPSMVVSDRSYQVR
jgi:hypothetical protein